MELPTLFGDIDRFGRVTIEDNCYSMPSPLDARRYGTRAGFVRAARARGGGVGRPIHVFFERLARIGAGRSAYTTLSLRDQNELGHCVPLTFRRSSSGTVMVEVTEIRGADWPRLSNYYRLDSLLTAVESCVKESNLYRRMVRKSPLRLRVLPPLRNAWAQYLVAGDGYNTRWPALYGGREVNCRVAALSFIWILMREPDTVRSTAVAELKRLFRG
jgi:hypothetical protein